MHLKVLHGDSTSPQEERRSLQVSARLHTLYSSCNTPLLLHNMDFIPIYRSEDRRLEVLTVSAQLSGSNVKFYIGIL